MYETHFDWCVGLSPVLLCYLIQKRSLATVCSQAQPDIRGRSEQDRACLGGVHGLLEL